MENKNDDLVYQFKTEQENKLNNVQQEPMQDDKNNKSKSKGAKIISIVVALIAASVVGFIKYQSSLPKSYTYKCEKTMQYSYGNEKVVSDVKINSGGYQFVINKEDTITFNIDLTDEIYAQFMESLKLIQCYDISTSKYNQCTDSHLNLGYTSLGYNTVIDRVDNKVIIKSSTQIGKETKASKKEIEEFIDEIEKESGAKCEKID